MACNSDRFRSGASLVLGCGSFQSASAAPANPHQVIQPDRMPCAIVAKALHVGHQRSMAFNVGADAGRNETRAAKARVCYVVGGGRSRERTRLSVAPVNREIYREFARKSPSTHGRSSLSACQINGLRTISCFSRITEQGINRDKSECLTAPLDFTPQAPGGSTSRLTHAAPARSTRSRGAAGRRSGDCQNP